MKWLCWTGLAAAAIAAWGSRASAAQVETFRVATYNLEGYLERGSPGRPGKSGQAKAMIRETIRALKPDVIALQEVGSPSALLELRDSLKAEGLDLPHWECVHGQDTNIHLGILSRFPFTARRPHTNENFLLGPHRFQVSRGFAEVDIQVSANYSFTLLNAHLKSRRPALRSDEAEQRLEEARLLRETIDARLTTAADANLVVLGDFNDSPNSPPIRTVIGRGRRRLLDTRPAEGHGDEFAAGPSEPGSRTVTWTYYYAKEDVYSRVDYLLLSPGMAREWVTNRTCVLALPQWGTASDHRPIVATFRARDQ